MILTPHAVAGGALALVTRRIQHPRRAIAASLGIGVLTHIGLDTIPHQDYPLVLGPLLLADCLAAYLLSRHNRLVMWGAFGGVLPDLIQGLERIVGVSITQPVHKFWHTGTSVSMSTGIMTQALLVLSVLSLVWLVRIHRASAQTARSKEKPLSGAELKSLGGVQLERATPPIQAEAD